MDGVFRNDVAATPAPRFLVAEWRDLALLNFEIEPSVLRHHVPVGCELDGLDGRTLVSVVGFRFLRTRVLGVPVPGHRDFEEVNLRFYVRRRIGGGWRRGVVFVKEMVPRRAVAFVARRLYGENYVALPMRHAIVDDPSGARRVTYQWRRQWVWERLAVSCEGDPTIPAAEAEETFITEHYWGYTRRPDGRTVEYEVEHPRWRVWPGRDAVLTCDVASLYGAGFHEALSAAPRNAFVAEGSAVVVRRGRPCG